MQVGQQKNAGKKKLFFVYACNRNPQKILHVHTQHTHTHTTRTLCHMLCLRTSGTPRPGAAAHEAAAVFTSQSQAFSCMSWKHLQLFDTSRVKGRFNHVCGYRFALCLILTEWPHQ